MQAQTQKEADREEYMNLQEGYFEQTNQILFLKKDNEEMVKVIRNLEDQNHKLSVRFVIRDCDLMRIE